MVSAKKYQQWKPLIKLFDIAVIVVALLVILALRGTKLDAAYVSWLAIVIGGFLYFAEVMHIYNTGKQQPNRVILARASLSLSLGFLAMIVISFMLKLTGNLSRLEISLWFFTSLFGLNLWRYCQHQLILSLRKQGYFQRRCAIYGLTESGIKLGNTIVQQDNLGLQMCGFYDDRQPDRFEERHASQLLGDSQALLKHAQQNEIDLLFIAIPFAADERIADLIRTLADSTLDIHVVFDHRITDLLHGTPMEIGNLDTISVFDSPYSGSMAIIKRTEDIILSLFFLIITALPMLVIFSAVKLTSKGPGIFVQTRYGLNGERIKVWKFRSMRTQDDGPVVKQATKDDPRITKVGKFIRRTSLDELPQFFNVLTGQMSIVGPRPHAVAHNEYYRNEIPYYMIRHKVKPGITGWAQANGWRGETDELYKMQKRVEFDLYYIRHWSVFFDLKIIFLTVFKGFVGKNTY